MNRKICFDETDIIFHSKNELIWELTHTENELIIFLMEFIVEWNKNNNKKNIIRGGPRRERFGKILVEGFFSSEFHHDLFIELNKKFNNIEIEKFDYGFNVKYK